MSAASAILAGRRAAEALMLDAGTASRPTGETHYNPDLQQSVPTMDVLFPSRCKIQARDILQAQEREVGGRTAVTVRLELHLPASTPPLMVGDIWDLTETHPLSTARLTQYRVLAPVGKTLATASRYEIEEIVS